MTTPRTRRVHGEGAVYETPDGRWKAALRVNHPTTGRQVRRWVSGRTRAEAVRKLEDLKRAAARGTVASSTTTGDYLTHWLATDRQSIRPSSWRQRDQYVRTHIIPAVGHVRLDRLTPADVQRMTDQMIANGKSPTTAAAVRVIFRRALSDALGNGHVTRNVAALARPPRVGTRAMERGRDYLDGAQLRALIAACEDHRLGPLVTVAATTGMRQGEVLGLRWQDVDLEQGTVTVQRALARSWDGGWTLADPKTARSRRTINLTDAGVAALQRQQEQQARLREAAGDGWQDRDGLVFTDAAGRPLRGYNVTKEFQTILAAAGLPRVPFHALRHSAATLMLTNGVPLRVVADVLGHSTIVVTANIYTAVVPELSRQAADAIQRALRRDVPD